MAKAAYPTIGIAALVMFGIVYFIGCLRKREKIFAIYSIQKGARGLRIKKKSRSTNASGFFLVTCFSKTNN